MLFDFYFELLDYLSTFLILQFQLYSPPTQATQMMITLEEDAMHLSCNTFHAQVQSQILDLLHSNMVQLDCNYMLG